MYITISEVTFSSGPSASLKLTVNALYYKKSERDKVRTDILRADGLLEKPA